MRIKSGILFFLNKLATNSPHHSINYSFLRLFSIKFGVLVNYTVHKFLVQRNSRKILKGTRLSSATYLGKVAIIVANGPSSKEINWDSVESGRRDGSCVLFVINHSLNDPHMFSRGADFLVLSDPGCHPKSDDTRTLNLWRNISLLPNLRLITPVSWHAEVGDPKCQTFECLHFSDLSLESIWKSTSPLKARGYPSLTAYKALAFAKYLGFRAILIAGFDNSMFRTIRVNHSNSLVQASNHFVEKYSPDSDVTSIYPNGIADYFAETAEMFLSLRRCFGRDNIINLGLNSEVDAFQKATKDTIWSDFVIQGDRA